MIRAGRLGALVCLLLAGASAAQPPRKGGRNMGDGYADPSAVITAEMAFSRLATEKGQWTAFAATSAKDAVMFMPRAVFAQRWLKGRKNPAAPVRWQPYKIFMSCDGGYAVSTGAWQHPDGSSGWFTTIWRREGKKGVYHWILDHGANLTTALEAPEAITARVGECRRRGRPGPTAVVPVTLPLVPGQPLPSSRDEASADGTLRWRWAVAEDGSRTLDAWLRTGEGEEQVVSDRAEAGK
ncbi:MAG: hypothetical protein ABW184_10525 [Sphingobium sp.]